VSKEFKIGLIVTSAIFMLYWGANFLSGQNIFNPQVEYFVKYENLDGLQASNDVRYEGAKIGLVSEVVFDNKATDSYCWVVKFSITREGVELMDSTIAEVGSADLLGTMILNLKKINKGVKPLNPSDTLIGIKSESLTDLVQGQIAPLKAKTDELLGTINTLVVSLQGVLDSTTQVNLKNSFAAIPKAIRSITHATASMDTIVDALKKARIASIINNVASITNNLKNNNAALTSMISNLDNITDSLAKANVKETIDRVNRVLNETTIIMEDINKGEGTVGMLLKDKQLYENIVLATADLDFLLMDFKQNPGRYVNISLFNFGSKKKKDAEPRDSSEYNQFFKNALLKAGLTGGKQKIAKEMLKEISDSCVTGCDSVKLNSILKKYSNK
jgi:phospholipid/cholesterol/gamma-HCH transport system substrate-binding protein